MIAFVGSMSLATAVLLPERTLRFSVFGSRLFEQQVQDDVFDIEVGFWSLQLALS